jgi:hypothetical protein
MISMRQIIRLINSSFNLRCCLGSINCFHKLLNVSFTLVISVQHAYHTNQSLSKFLRFFCGILLREVFSLNNLKNFFITSKLFFIVSRRRSQIVPQILRSLVLFAMRKFPYFLDLFLLISRKNQTILHFVLVFDCR